MLATGRSDSELWRLVYVLPKYLGLLRSVLICVYGLCPSTLSHVHTGLSTTSYDHIKMKTSPDSPGVGVSFRNLSVYGVGDLCDYQSTFGNFIHRAISRCRKLFSQRKSKTRILKDFNGLVRKGEMLLVLGRPGSGCSTLLKTLTADTHGLSIDDASVLKYQGECLPCVITGTKR
jgi:ABC-type multidrug transport system fused ATPase/permease subunit